MQKSLKIKNLLCLIIAVIAHSTNLFIQVAADEIILIKKLLLMLEQIEPDGSGRIKPKTRQVRKILYRLEKSKR